MNPGAFVAGGGGDGGGKGGKGGKNGNGDEGAGTGDGDEDANGGENGSAACGSGEAGSCTNCGSNMSAGDPIDLARGSVFTPAQTDLCLPGFFRLDLARMYNSLARKRDVGFGFGWSFTLGWRLEVRRREAVVHKPDGKSVTFPLPDGSAWAESPMGWLLRKVPSGFELDARDEFRHFFEHSTDAKAFHLTRVRDPHGNTVEVTYKGSHLHTITDTTGRVITAQVDQQGRVRALELLARGTNTRFVEYSYDPAGNLVEARHMGGHWTRYSYDAAHQLTRVEHPSGLCFHFKYNTEGQCIETWGDYLDGSTPGLSADVPALLRDGTTKARGYMHVRVEYGADGYREVFDSIRHIRLFTNAFNSVEQGVTGSAVTSRTFNDKGHITSRTNALGDTTHYSNDDAGRLVTETDPMGHRIEIIRDANGRVVETIDPLGGVGRATYNLSGARTSVQDQRGNAVLFAWDARGSLESMTEPNGARTRFTYDQEANLAELTLPSGGSWKYTYNEFGRCTSSTDPLGNVTQYNLDQAQRVAGKVLPNGGRTTFTYDAMNRLVFEADADGKWRRYEWSVFDQLTRTEFSNGDTLRWEYNREGWPVSAYNEAGRKHALVWNENRQLTEEQTFDGRRLTFNYDLMSRVTAATNGAGEWREYEYDASGEVTKQTYEDGEELDFERNARGEITRAITPHAVTDLVRDAVGDVTRESLSIDGREFWVERELDPCRCVSALRTSQGHSVEVTRDAFRRRTSTTLDNQHVLAFRHNALGQQIELAAPSVKVESRYSNMGWLVERSLNSPSSARPDGTPEYVGLDPNARRMQYVFTPAGAVSAKQEGALQESYEYDQRSRITKVERSAAVLEEYAYAPTGNRFPKLPGQAAQYDADDRLLLHGSAAYEYDSDGRLTKRARYREDSETSEEIFSWSSRGLLTGYQRDEAVRIEYAYDAFARLVRRVELTFDASVSRWVPSATTYFVWSGRDLIHQVWCGPDGEERTSTFAYEDRDGALLAQRLPNSPWELVVRDFNDTPRKLVRLDTGVDTPVDLGTFGGASAASTPHRFLGQLADPETGLHYNKARYYDPESGRYISPDPMGLLGDTNPYGYCPDPLNWVDPDGLRARRPPHEVDTVTLTTPGPPPTSTTPSGTGRPNDSFYSGYTSDPRYPGREDSHCAGLSPGSAYWESHTERKAMRWAEETTGYDPESNPDALRGAHLGMNGQKAPCNTCNRAMERWTAETGANVTYTWPTGQRRTYSGGTGSGDIRTPYERAPT